MIAAGRMAAPEPPAPDLLRWLADGVPKVIVPMVIVETFRPERPSSRYSMTNSP